MNYNIVNYRVGDLLKLDRDVAECNEVVDDMRGNREAMAQVSKSKVRSEGPDGEEYAWRCVASEL